MTQTIFITGASSGIGAAAARAFAIGDVRLILAARRIDRLNALASRLSVAAHLIELDVRDRTSVHSAIENLPEGFREIDVLVNNAGLSRGFDLLHEGSEDDWDEMLDTNVKGLLYVTRSVLPGMVTRGRGHIINIGSVAGHETYPRGNVYCASKAAVGVINKGLRLDLLGTGVRVSSVDPGLVPTEFSDVRFHGDNARAAKVYEGTRPLSAADVAEAIVWCASRPAWVNVEDILLMPTDQAAAAMTHRRDLPEAERRPEDSLAQRWLAAWNGRDLEALMKLYVADARHSSERVVAAGHSNDTLVGAAAIRDYFQRAMQRFPELHFEARAIASGWRTTVIEYLRRGAGEPQLVVELLETDPENRILHSRVYHP